MTILQKAADFIFAMDKIKSAVYNAPYTAHIGCCITSLLSGRLMNQKAGKGIRRLLFVLHNIAVKIQRMTEEKNRNTGTRKNFVICDDQEEYSENLFRIFMRNYPGEYQFHIFHDIEKTKIFSAAVQISILLISSGYGEDNVKDINADRIYLLSESLHYSPESEVREKIKGCIFRYQSAGKIMEQISHREHPSLRKERPRIRDEPVINGIIGIYSPVHRIGKTKFALRIGYQAAARAPALYLNMEGISGENYYFKDNPGYDMGDLLYCLRQNGVWQGMKISSMTGHINGLDFILPMKNDVDFRSVKAEEWISLLDTIREKCFYECIILDLGDSVNGLYEIMKKCSRIYTPYIEDEPASAKMDQYERNLQEAGYGEILERTVKRKMKRNRYPEERNGGFHEADRTAL